MITPMILKYQTHSIKSEEENKQNKI